MPDIVIGPRFWPGLQRSSHFPVITDKVVCIPCMGGTKRVMLSMRLWWQVAGNHRVAGSGVKDRRNHCGLIPLMHFSKQRSPYIA